MSISNNINILKQIKANLKNSIESKGEDLTNVPFTNYSKKIDAIETSGDLVNPLTLQEDTILALEQAFDNLETPKADLDYVMQISLFENLLTMGNYVKKDFSTQEVESINKILKNITEGETL